MIWLIGNKGMLGTELSKHLEEEKIDFIGSDREVSILEPPSLGGFANTHKPSLIINCSAYTAVDKAEEDKDAAYAINQTGVANIARLAAARDIPLIHISTDYVFDGTSSIPLKEDAPTGPEGVYGMSKLAGEEEIRKIAPKHFIIRTAWLYGQYGPNFVYTMMKLMNKLEAIKVVNDQKGSPTWTRDLTGLIVSILKQRSDAYGTYHLSGEGECTWFGFAREIYKMAREKGLVTRDCAVNPCTSSEFPTPAKRPAYSLMSKEKVKSVLGYGVRAWTQSLEMFLTGMERVVYDVSNWLEHSEYDLETARVMHSQGRYTYTAFMCQQALEKQIKGISVFFTGKHRFSHDLLFLAKSANIDFDDEQEYFLDELNLTYIKSRYSERMSRLSKIWTKSKSEECLEKTEELYKWLNQRIPYCK